MDGDETAPRFPSGIPVFNAQGRSLNDITTAANNHATGNGSMKPPPSGSINRKFTQSSSSRPEPPSPRRMTLAEKAGQPRNKPPHSHGPLSSLSSRTSSTSSTQPVSRTSHAHSSSVRHASRPAQPQSGRHISRPQTSFGYSAQTDRNRSPRPATSMDTRDDDSVLGKRKEGKQQQQQQLSSVSSASLSGPRRGSYDTHLNYTSDWSTSAAARSSKSPPQPSTRNSSLCHAMDALSLNQAPSSNATVENNSSLQSPSPSKLPQPKDSPKCPSPTASVVMSQAPSCPKTPQKASRKSPSKVVPFLTRNSQVQAWDESAKLEEFRTMYNQLVKSFEGTANHGIELNQAVELYKSRVQELEAKQTDLTDQNVNLRVELDTLKSRASSTETKLQEAERNHEIAVDDLDNKQRIESESIRQEAKRQLDATVAQHQEELRELRRRCDTEIDEERQLRSRDINELNTQSAADRQRDQIDAENKDRELQSLKQDLERVRGELERERSLNKGLQENLATSNSNTITLESSIRALNARIEFLESGNQEQSDAFSRLNEELNSALAETHETNEKLRKEETLRRRLHNQVQELKGNIRVFCRVRPLLPAEPTEDSAMMNFPDEEVESKEISVQGPAERSSLGTNTTKKHAFSFDHVFGQNSQNSQVFDEISQLVQSALDGYNVCIFCYGQTGSGKTYTMSSDDGMITRAVHQIYDTARSLEPKGWTYVMEGSVVELYNENLNDLLGKAEEFDKKKHEIRHDMQKSKTTITDITTVTLDSPATVESILQRAATNRSVAATKVNERSSRSHSVFILKLIGENTTTGERSEGTLNLVDLAGSERLSQSGATGERLKETQNINRSLSCLGDVIGALGGQGKEGGHIPYRNSKLTYLLQFSLGGNSKTLMFVNVSPRMEHLGETLTSLRFATKVHNTHIGTARRQTKVRE